ncbi:hypothetical protein TPHA_0F03690 [Tetrapisispora phaffii CBS 4417]|uniref:NAD-dependent epimerase/dehydratase domain-containing protein n=1 Tax=Tetrapisispora phaffii (strain ATCC 24235 / CBS 4417 / NBRC 1672 / NRRL Y-8282 / UCD 70-5) TaxID=1071381 RepID=G8BUR3_TETPH|nr:hypothetical protein TPHA_0F03690 [Tetrapisispora phaffii CBS 4417]CCE63849.1 hypothetical protein TPHA_0F03690 [Tetrapisispora phaffii CBS 4417]
MSAFISGATGFIAQHIVDGLLKQNYKVIGTARSQEKANKLMKQFSNNPNLSMEIVGDISDVNAFDEVMKKRGSEIKYVLHTASPFHFNVTDIEKELLVPAVNGTRGILNSIKKYANDTVERVVITSSFAAILDLNRFNDNSLVLSEANWNPVTKEEALSNPMAGYCASKTYAERAAWDFLKENEGSIKFKLTTVNPVYVFGPQLFAEDVKNVLNTSCEVVNQVVQSTIDTTLPVDCSGQFVDVRDVAKAHIAGIQNDNCIGQRLLCSQAAFGVQDIANVLNDNFPQLKGKIAKSNPKTNAVENIGICQIDNSKTKELLGFEFIDLKTCLIDTVSQIVEQKIIGLCEY